MSDKFPLLQLDTNDPRASKWENKFHTRMTNGENLWLKGRDPNHGIDQDQSFRRRVLIDLSYVLEFAGKDPTIPYSQDAIQQLHEDFLQAIPSLQNEEYHTDNLEAIFNLMISGKWTEVLFSVSFCLLKEEESPDVMYRKQAFKNSAPFWEDKYEGNTLVAFLDRLKCTEAQFDESTMYSKTIDVIQSSGSGKSRLVAESGKQIIQISFYLRNCGDNGHPPGDPEVYKFLKAGDLNYANTHARAIAFLGAFVSCFSDWYQHSFDHTLTPSMESILQLWNSHMNSTREGSMEGRVDFRSDTRIDFCRSLVLRAMNYLQETLDNSAKGNNPRIKWDWDTDIDYTENLWFDHLVLGPMRALFDRLPLSDDPYLPGILLGIDEAANLLEDSKKLKHLSTLRITAIRRVMRAVCNFPIWTVFLSTNGRMEAFTIHKESDPSTRVNYGELNRIPPFMAFEIHIHERSRRMNPNTRKFELDKSMADISTLEHITGLGRPLWRIFSKRKYTELREFALTKLLGGKSIYNTYDKNHVFAALSSRITLIPAQNKNNVQFAWNQVNSHLALLVSVDIEKGTLLTTTASEPVVSDAVAYMLMSHPPNDSKYSMGSRWVSTLITATKCLLNTGMSNQGQRGEIYTQLMVILVRDILLFEKRVADKELNMSQYFPMAEFLDTFLGKDFAFTAYCEHISFKLESTPNKEQPNHNPNAGYLNFTHFEFTDNHLVPEQFPAILLDLIRSNAALQLAGNQSTWDQLIPVYYGNPNEPINTANLGAVFIQSKIREEGVKLIVRASDYKNILPDGSLAILIQIEAGVESRKAHFTTASLPDFIWRKKKGNRRKASAPFVLGFQIFGHSEDNFPFLKKVTGLNKAMQGVIDTIKHPGGSGGLDGQIRKRLWGYHPLSYFDAPVPVDEGKDADGDVGMSRPGED